MFSEDKGEGTEEDERDSQELLLVDKSKSSFTITLMEDGDCEITAAEAIAEHEKSVDRLKGQLLDLKEGKARVDSITADQKRVKVKMASLGKKASAEAKKALQEKLDALELEYDLEEYQQLRKEWKDISVDIRKQEKALAKLRKNATPSKEAAEATKAHLVSLEQKKRNKIKKPCRHQRQWTLTRGRAREAATTTHPRPRRRDGRIPRSSHQARQAPS